MSRLKCDTCGEQAARIRPISRSYGSGKNLLVVEGTPLISCSSCGESYFTAETLHEVERIKGHREGFAQPRPVSVARFHQAAEPVAQLASRRQLPMSPLHGPDVGEQTLSFICGEWVVEPVTAHFVQNVDH